MPSSRSEESTELTSPKISIHKSFVTHPAKMLGLQIQIRHQTDGLREEWQWTFPVLRNGTYVCFHGLPFNRVQSGECYIETILTKERWHVVQMSTATEAGGAHLETKHIQAETVRWACGYLSDRDGKGFGRILMLYEAVDKFMDEAVSREGDNRIVVERNIFGYFLGMPSVRGIYGMVAVRES
jgi:hypothetical protein